jgi:hypothetical protein
MADLGRAQRANRLLVVVAVGVLVGEDLDRHAELAAILDRDHVLREPRRAAVHVLAIGELRALTGSVDLGLLGASPRGPIAPAGPRPRLEDRAVVAGLAELVGGHEPRHPGAQDHDRLAAPPALQAEVRSRRCPPALALRGPRRGRVRGRRHQPKRVERSRPSGHPDTGQELRATHRRDGRVGVRHRNLLGLICPPGTCAAGTLLDVRRRSHGPIVGPERSDLRHLVRPGRDPSKLPQADPGHGAAVARSARAPAVAGLRASHQLSVRQADWANRNSAAPPPAGYCFVCHCECVHGAIAATEAKGPSARQIRQRDPPAPSHSCRRRRGISYWPRVSVSSRGVSGAFRRACADAPLDDVGELGAVEVAGGDARA